MKLSRSQISKFFFSSENYRVFCSRMEKVGFAMNLNGVNKAVFIHPDWHWVVKLCYDCDKKPRNGAKINKYYLPPRECGKRRFEDIETRYNTYGGVVWLQFQHKVENVGNYDVYENFLTNFN